ncbi:MAG: nitrite reductase small subunit NirD [Porticoccaceae bacterium]|nr:nitrite reductase small subunit NirD [Porticoccaceae bacterium]
MSQVTICEQKDLVANSGVCAMVDGRQIALFYLPEETPQIYAIGNWDPIGKANVLSRGMVGDINERLVVASPLYKQHFDLQTGECLEDDEHGVPVYSVELTANKVILTL